MIDLAKQAEIAADETFRGRVAAACYTVALDILSEDKEITNEVRKINAQSVIMSDISTYRRLSALIVANLSAEDHATIITNQQDIPDKFILKSILLNWNTTSGLL